MTRLTATFVLAATCLGACSEHHGAAAGADNADNAAGVGGAGGSAGAGAATGASDAAGAEPGGAAGAAGAAAALAECGGTPEPNGWATWVMPNPVQSGLPNPASYAVSDSNNQVTDDVTGLTWQRTVNSNAMPWEDAKRYCACLTLDGDDGWRLPSRIELASLVDWTTASPSIDVVAFPSTTNENFWTSSVVTRDTDLVYLVFFLNGHTTYATPDYEYRARCVRSSPALPAARYAVADGTVNDTQTKLTWQRAFPPERYAWADANAYCAGLSLDGSGWRLPSINELQTLVDDATNPAIDLTTFPLTPSEYFWSSSAVVDDATRAWTTFFTNGSTYSFPTTSPKNVRCVR